MGRAGAEGQPCTKGSGGAGGHQAQCDPAVCALTAQRANPIYLQKKILQILVWIQKEGSYFGLQLQKGESEGSDSLVSLLLWQQLVEWQNWKFNVSFTKIWYNKNTPDIKNTKKQFYHEILGTWIFFCFTLLSSFKPYMYVQLWSKILWCNNSTSLYQWP